jgi:hypothetical protein
MSKQVFVRMLTLALLASCSTTSVKETPPADQVMCAQDVIQCPDGSWAGRTGPHCEFKCSGTPFTAKQ